MIHRTRWKLSQTILFVLVGVAPLATTKSAQAAWLAEQDDGNWMYEAYLQSGALAGDFAPAGYLQRYLASGALWD